MYRASSSHDFCPRSPFLGLPTELRLQIYTDLSQLLRAPRHRRRYTIDGDDIFMFTKHQKFAPLLALLQTRHKVRTEVQDLIYAQTAFTIMVQRLDEGEIRDRIREKAVGALPFLPDTRFLKHCRELLLAGDIKLVLSKDLKLLRNMAAMLDSLVAERLDKFRLVIFDWPSSILSEDVAPYNSEKVGSAKSWARCTTVILRIERLVIARKVVEKMVDLFFSRSTKENEERSKLEALLYRER